MTKVRLEAVLAWTVMGAGSVTVLVAIVGPGLMSPRLGRALSFVLPLAMALLWLLEIACPATIWVKIDTGMTMWLRCLWFASALVVGAAFAIVGRVWLHVIIYLLLR